MRLLDSATDRVESHTYPATTTELVDAYGDTELQLPNGTETFGDVMGRLTEETYDDAEQARLALYSAVSTKGIGRVGYSDRDPTCLGEDGPEQQSI